MLKKLPTNYKRIHPKRVIKLCCNMHLIGLVWLPHVYHLPIITLDNILINFIKIAYLPKIYYWSIYKPHRRWKGLKPTFSRAVWALGTNNLWALVKFWGPAAGPPYLDPWHPKSHQFIKRVIKWSLPCQMVNFIPSFTWWTGATIHLKLAPTCSTIQSLACDERFGSRLREKVEVGIRCFTSPILQTQMIHIWTTTTNRPNIKLHSKAIKW